MTFNCIKIKQQHLNKLDELSILIEESNSQAIIVKFYRNAASILKAVSEGQHSDLDEIISDLHEAMDTIQIQDEISSLWENNPAMALGESELQQMLPHSSIERRRRSYSYLLDQLDKLQITSETNESGESSVSSRVPVKET